MSSIFEKYRPKSFSEVIGQEKAVKILAKLKERAGFGGRAYWISAASGTGKTTLARLIAQDLAGSEVVEIDAQDCTMDFVRDMEEDFRVLGRALFFAAGASKAWIVNEAHGLRGAVLSRFLTAIEKLPDCCAIIFTTTKAGQESLFEEMADASPLLSRCIDVPMTARGLADVFAQRALEIARAEGMDGKPLASYKRLMMDCRNNLRMALSRIEAGEMAD